MSLRLSTAILAMFSAISLAALFIETGPTSQIGLSLGASRKALRACIADLAPPYADLLPTLDITARNTNCSRSAKRALRQMPTDGLASFVLALSAYRTGDTGRQDAMLAQSVRFAPHEGWLAQNRFVFAIASQMQFREANIASIRRDIATMLDTQFGAELLARYFLRRPEVRAQILAVSKTASGGRQQRLANLVRQRRADR